MHSLHAHAHVSVRLSPAHCRRCGHLAHARHWPRSRQALHRRRGRQDRPLRGSHARAGRSHHDRSQRQRTVKSIATSCRAVDRHPDAAGTRPYMCPDTSDPPYRRCSTSLRTSSLSITPLSWRACHRSWWRATSFPPERWCTATPTWSTASSSSTSISAAASLALHSPQPRMLACTSRSTYTFPHPALTPNTPTLNSDGLTVH